MGATAKRYSAHAPGRFTAGPKRQQNLAVGGAFPNRMIKSIGQPDTVVGTNRYRVRVGKSPLVAPGAEKFTVLIYHDHRTIAAIE